MKEVGWCLFVGGFEAEIGKLLKVNIPYLVRSANRGKEDSHTRQDPSMDRPPPMICRVLKFKRNEFIYIFLIWNLEKKRKMKLIPENRLS